MHRKFGYVFGSNMHGVLVVHLLPFTGTSCSKCVYVFYFVLFWFFFFIRFLSSFNAAHVNIHGISFVITAAKNQKCTKYEMCSNKTVFFFSFNREKEKTKRSFICICTLSTKQMTGEKERDKKTTQSTNTDYKANAYNSDAYADL